MAEQADLLSQEVVPLHYDLEIETNTETRDDRGKLHFQGEVSVLLDIQEFGVKSITLNAEQIQIKQLCTFSVVGSNEVFKSSFIEYRRMDSEVEVFFAAELPLGQGTLQVPYTGLHTLGQKRGFYEGFYTDAQGIKRTMVSTHLEPGNAKYCFPCIDEPAQKATFQCSLVVNETQVALANMPIASTRSLGNGRKRVIFEVTPVMSTYLIGFCVSELEYLESKTKSQVIVRAYTAPGKKEHGRFALDVAVKALELMGDLFEEKFGQPKIDLIAISDFPAGAMENWGIVMFRSPNMLVNPVVETPSTKRKVITTVVHELAHHWFGNLVTMEWWNDLWLKEGFATFMEYYIVDKLDPSWRMEESHVSSVQQTALSGTSLKSPLRTQVKNSRNAQSVFDSVRYQKGSCIVKLTLGILGEEKFMQALRLYISRHKYSSTRTEHLWQAMEEVSGRDISGMMFSWVEQAGFPLVTVVNSEWSKGQCKLTLMQEPFSDDRSEALWHIPIFISTKHGTVLLDEALVDRRQEIVVKVKKDVEWLKLNGGQYVPMRVKYTAQCLERLARGAKQGSMSTCDKIGLLLDANSLFRSTSIDPGFILQILGTCGEEMSYPVFDVVSKCLKRLRQGLCDLPELLEQFNSYVAALIQSQAVALGWDDREGDNGGIRLLRAVIVSLQCTYAYSEPRVGKEALARLRRYLQNPKDEVVLAQVPLESRMAIFTAALSNCDGAEEFNMLLGIVKSLGTYEFKQKREIYGALGAVRDPALQLEALEWACSGEFVKSTLGISLIFGSVANNGKEGAELAMNFLKDNLDRIHKQLVANLADPLGWLFFVLQEMPPFGNEETAEEIVEFFKGKNVTFSMPAVVGFAKRIKKNSRVAESIRQSETFQATLEEFVTS